MERQESNYQTEFSSCVCIICKGLSLKRSSNLFQTSNARQALAEKFFARLSVFRFTGALRLHMLHMNKYRLRCITYISFFHSTNQHSLGRRRQKSLPSSNQKTIHIRRNISPNFTYETPFTIRFFSVEAKPFGLQQLYIGATRTRGTNPYFCSPVSAPT